MFALLQKTLALSQPATPVRARLHGYLWMKLKWSSDEVLIQSDVSSDCINNMIWRLRPIIQKNKMKKLLPYLLLFLCCSSTAQEHYIAPTDSLVIKKLAQWQ